MLANYPVYFVGVHCSVEELERREKLKGDRRIGQAKKQLDFVHQQNEPYHLEVNTDQGAIGSNTQAIIELINY